MSNRALKKLHGGNDIIVPGVSDGSESQEEASQIQHPVVKNRRKKKRQPRDNPFDLLNNEDDSINNADIDGDDDSVINNDAKATAEICNDAININHKVTKKKKKRKKKKIAEENKPVTVPSDEDEIDAGIREVNTLLGTIDSSQLPANFTTAPTTDYKSLLNVEHKNLNPDNELRRIFGSRVVHAEQTGRRNRGRRRRATWLAQPTDSWPPMTKTGLSMTILETQNNGQYFSFEHSQQYQRVQFQFLDAVESLSHENIMALLQLHPYHIDSLLQLSEVCRISEDMQMAAELTARALYSFEMSFHPMFSLTTGTCRLDFKYPENRSFYLAIFRHLNFVGQRGCYRTAMEFSKLLLSLDPDGDPMGVLLLIDFYALRAEMYSYLVRMSQEWTDRNLSQLPNFAFSIPLAMYHLAVQNSEPTTKADEMIQISLLMFPGLLMPLLDKCSITPDKQVSSHSYFGLSTRYSEGDGLKQLISLYVCRCFSCWKDPDVMQWLEENVKKVLKRVDDNDPLVPEFAQKRKTRYQRTPRNVYRHIIISEVKDATAALPPDLMNTPILSYDPVPPVDSVTSYTRSRRPTRLEQDGNPLSTFLRSLLPNFNPEEPAPEGAAGGENANSLRQGIGVLMDAMRDLLNNIRPVEPPIENHDEGADNSDDDNWQEWD